MFRSAALVPLDCHCGFVVLIIGVAPLPGNQTRKGPWECHDPQIPWALAEGSPDHPACQGAKVCYPSQLQHFNRLIYDHDLMIKSGCHKQRLLDVISSLALGAHGKLWVFFAVQCPTSVCMVTSLMSSSKAARISSNLGALLDEKRLSTTNPPMYSPHLQQDTPLPHTFREGHQPRRYFQTGHFLISWFPHETSNGSLATKAPN